MIPIRLILRWLPAALLVLSCAACGGSGSAPDEEVPPAPLPETPATRYEAWPELPTCTTDNAHWHYGTHFAPVYSAQEGKSVQGRNYTFCFDDQKRASWWVAYPLHSAHRGSGRPNPDPWAYDPTLSAGWQANVALGSYTGNYDRGHQIPNADRNADISEGSMCYQTFYASNVTPQASALNQESWADLENYVRTWICADTLYVVTGAYWSPDNTRTTTDRSGNVCPVPDHYFKVLARTTSGNLRTAGDLLKDLKSNQLKTIGFWVENSDAHAYEKPKTWIRSVAEIEQLTGFSFFPTLPESVKAEANPSAWGLQ